MVYGISNGNDSRDNTTFSKDSEDNVDDRGLVKTEVNYSRKGEVFDCKFCNAKFLSKICLQVHLQLYAANNSNNDYICYYCGRGFLNKCGLIYHIKRNSDNICRICNLHFNKKENARIHMRNRHSSPVRCKSCNQYFSIMEHLYCLDDFDRIKGRFIVCKLCGERFATKIRMLKHIQSHDEVLCKLCYKMRNNGDGFISKFITSHHVQVKKRGQNSVRGDHRPRPPRVRAQRSLECDTCGRCYTQKRYLARHIIEKHFPVVENYPVTCDKCGKSFAYDYRLRRHYEDTLCGPADRGPFSCDKCKKEYYNKSHLRFHFLSSRCGYRPPYKSFVCTSCGKAYYTKYHLGRHSRMHNVERHIFMCDKCGKIFAEKSSLKIHIRYTRCGNKSMARFSRDVYEDASASGNNNNNNNCNRFGPSPHGEQAKRSYDDYDVLNAIFTCDTCGRNFPCKSYLKRHLKKTRCGQPFINDFTGRLVPLKRFMRQNITIMPNTDEVVCGVCDKKLSAMDVFRNHLIRHLEDKCHVCDTCGQKFRYKDRLNSHIRHAHKDLTRTSFNCGICGKKFATKNNLRNHERTHSTEKPYSCKVCGKDFHFGYKLKRHELSHSGKRSFQCDTCGKSYFSHSGLKDHMTGHSDESPYPCKICGKSFILKSTMTHHMSTHLDPKLFACNICGRGYENKFSLKKHVSQHIAAGNKQFTCHTCGKMFTSKQLALSHLKVHSEENNFF